jgi:hypothetical protein
VPNPWNVEHRIVFNFCYVFLSLVPFQIK